MDIYLLPKEIKEYIISLTKNSLNDLIFVNNDFGIVCPIIKITNNKNYPKITDNEIKGLINLTYLYLLNNKIITDDGIKGLINLTSILRL